jgi:N-methylhydantoinase B/oxoprolinase/acetone carboxylase alpha subunit
MEIIQVSGNMESICKNIETLISVFGKDATLSEVSSVVNYGRTKTAVRKQIEEIKRGLE